MGIKPQSRNNSLFSEWRAREDYYLRHYAKGIPISSRARIVKVLEMARESASTVEKLLDVGCGDGTVGVMLKHVTGAKEVYGIEISPEAAKLAEKKGVKVIVLDLEKQELPLPNDAFDLIYCGDIIEHVFEPLDLLKNLWRVLRKDGTCVITTPNLASWYNRVFLLFGYQPYGTACSLKISSAGKAFSGIVSDWGGEHIRVMTVKAFRTLIEASGFKLCKLEGIYGIPPATGLLNRFAGVIDKILSKIPSLATWIIALAKK